MVFGQPLSSGVVVLQNCFLLHHHHLLVPFFKVLSWQLATAELAFWLAAGFLGAEQLASIQLLPLVVPLHQNHPRWMYLLISLEQSFASEQQLAIIALEQWPWFVALLARLPHRRHCCRRWTLASIVA